MLPTWSPPSTPADASTVLPASSAAPARAPIRPTAEARRAFSHERSVLVQRRPSIAHVIYPPYGERMDRLLCAVRRWFT